MSLITQIFSMAWITIKRFTYPHEVAIPRSLLESHDIKTFTMDENTTQIHNFYSNAIGGIKLQVSEADYDKAYSILHEGGFLDKPQVEENDGISKRNSVLKNIVIAAIVLTALLAMVFLFNSQ